MDLALNPTSAAALESSFGRHALTSLKVKMLLIGMVGAGLAFLIELPAVGRSIPADIGLVLAPTSWCVTGMYLLNRPRRHRLGIAMIIAGLGWIGSQVGLWDFGPSGELATVSISVFWLATCWGIFTFPDDLVQGRPERWFKLYFTISWILVQAVINMSVRPERVGFRADTWWYAPFVSKHSLDFVTALSTVIDIVSVVLFAAAMQLRLRRIGKLDRQVIVPSTLGFIVVAAVGSVTVNTSLDVFTPGAIIFYFAIALAPLGFVIGDIRSHATHSSVAAMLDEQLGTQVRTTAEIQNALRVALKAPALQVFLWHPAATEYFSPDGRQFSEADKGDGFVEYIRTRTDEPLAVIVDSESIVEQGRVVNTALRSSATALENAQLHAALLTQIGEINRSRARIAEAAIDERRRIERDLHDGVQQRLLAISAGLGTLKRSLANQDSRDSAETLSNHLQNTLAELRDLVNGIHPPELRQFGLAAAIRNVCESLPVAVDENVTTERFEPAVEATIYFTMCEALSNMMKHSAATRALITVERVADTIEFTINDNGCGEANASGKGITGMLDRVRSIGGTAQISSSPETGTIISGSVPVS